MQATPIFDTLRREYFPTPRERAQDENDRRARSIPDFPAELAESIRITNEREIQVQKNVDKQEKMFTKRRKGRRFRA